MLLSSGVVFLPSSERRVGVPRSQRERGGSSTASTWEEQPLAQRIARTTPIGGYKEEAESPPRTLDAIETIEIASTVSTDITDDEMSARDGEMSERSTLTSASKKRKRGRGRPPLDEEANKKRKAKLAEEAQEIREQQIRDLTDPNVEAPRSLNRRKLESWAKEEILYLPSRAIPATILAEIRAIDKVAQTSRNLSGPYQGCLNKAAAKLTAKLSYERREEIYPVGAAALIEEMRESMAALRTENEILKKRIEDLENKRNPVDQDPKVTENRVNRSKGKTRGPGPRRRIVSSSSPSSDDEMAVDPEIRAEEVRREICREGMPAAVRPPLQGKSRVIDPAKPAEGGTSPAEPTPPPPDDCKHGGRSGGQTLPDAFRPTEEGNGSEQFAFATRHSTRRCRKGPV